MIRPEKHAMAATSAQEVGIRKKLSLDVEFCRDCFPALSGDWVFLENAGGTLMPKQVIDALTNYASNYQVQPNEGYYLSLMAGRCIERGRAALANLINAHPDEIVVGPSTTSNVYALSHAFKPLLRAGDEIIVTNQDHEANNGAWRRLEAAGAIVREWRMNPGTEDLEIVDLRRLLNDKTRLVCVTHCSNIVGRVHDLKEITDLVHDCGGLVCADGVATVPHRRVDVKEAGVDFYLYSPYKVFGPHMGVLYGRREILETLPNQSHYFLAGDDFQRKFCPGGLNYELTAAAAGMAEYFDRVHSHHFPGVNVDADTRLDQVFKLFTAHESSLARRIEEFLQAQPGIRVIGEGAAGRERVGVFSFLVEGQDSRRIPPALGSAGIGLYADDFYASRCIDAIGARPQHGVIRASLVHYNSSEDIDRFIRRMEAILPT